MSEQKELKMVAAGDPAMEKLFEAFDEHQVLEDFDLKSVELALKKVELDLKNIRKALKGYRKSAKPTAEVLKG
jgi:hypothetical protein